MKNDMATILQQYAQKLGPYFPSNCGNLLVAAQYALPLQIVFKYLKPKSTLLDWGCGGGHFSYLLMQESYHVHSYSYSTGDDLATVKQHLNKEWELSQSEGLDPITLPYKNQSYEGVISLGVLEHVRETGGDERGSLQEIYRILKPGGYFCCFHFPNRYSWIEMLSRALNRAKINKFCHSHLYTKRDILDLVGSTSFHLKEMGKYNLFPRNMLRLLPKKLAYNHGFLATYNAMEKFCALFFARFSQNYYFVLQKNHK
jgi:cyclopropane fatty-acyl-phospholipid synthase-like methyltransferase